MGSKYQKPHKNQDNRKVCINSSRSGAFSCIYISIVHFMEMVGLGQVLDMFQMQSRPIRSSPLHIRAESEIISPYWLDICPVKGTFGWIFVQSKEHLTGHFVKMGGVQQSQAITTLPTCRFKR